MIAEEDYLSQRGATELANRLRSHWAGKGHRVDVTVEEVQAGKRKKTFWIVKSNLVRGNPPPPDSDCTAVSK
jgi:hypothetical protein